MDRRWKCNLNFGVDKLSGVKKTGGEKPGNNLGGTAWNGTLFTKEGKEGEEGVGCKDDPDSLLA